MNFNEFKNTLKEYSPETVVFVGLGNEWACDDAAGLYLFRKIQELDDFRGSVFIEAGRTPENYLQPVIDAFPECVVFIDAVRSSGSDGDISWINSRMVDEAGFSTHTFSLVMMEDYIRAFHQTDILYLGINISGTPCKGNLSQKIINAIENFLPQEVKG